MRRLSYILLVAALFLAAASARSGDLSNVEIKAARKLYIGKCAKCHKLHDPTTYSDSDWSSWMRKMTRKARLTPEQEELLSRYLDTVRKPGKTGGL